jgi:hypothetical protein
LESKRFVEAVSYRESEKVQKQSDERQFIIFSLRVVFKKRKAIRPSPCMNERTKAVHLQWSDIKRKQVVVRDL